MDSHLLFLIELVENHMRSILTNTISSSTIFLLQTFYIKGRNATDRARGHITLLTPLFSLLVHITLLTPLFSPSSCGGHITLLTPPFSLLVHVEDILPSDTTFLSPSSCGGHITLLTPLFSPSSCVG